MRTLLLVTVALAFATLAAWLLFAPAEIDGEPRALGAAEALLGSGPIETLTAEAKTERADARRDEEAEAAPSSSAKHVRTCAELFRPGDLWVRWLDRDGRAASAPRTTLTTVEKPDEHYVSPDHTHESEQLWKIDEVSWAGVALREQRSRIRVELIPNAALVEVPYDRARVTPLELRLPPHGELVVVVDDSGFALPAETRCKVHVHRVVPRDADEYEFLDSLEGPLGVELRRPLVSLDAEFDVDVIAFRGQLRERQRALGPRRDGEIRRIVLSFGASRPLLSARLQDEQGAPLGAQQLRAKWSGSKSPLHAQLFTTPDGRMVWTPELEGEAPYRGDFELSINTGAFVLLRDSELPASGVVDLGALQLRVPEAGFGGRVVDAAGAPVPKAVVELELLHIAGAAPEAPLPEFLRESLQKAADDAGGDLPAEDLEVAGQSVTQTRTQHGPLRMSFRTDAHGRFAWNDPRAADARNEVLAVAKLGFRSSPLRAYRGGERALELRLEAVGDLGGRALLPAATGLPITLRLRTAAAVLPSAREHARTRLTPRGTFRFMALPAGRYDLEVELETNERNDTIASLLSLRDLVVPVGESCADLRLDPIDLRELFAVFAFELRNAPAERMPERDAIWFRRSDVADAPWNRLPPSKTAPFTWLLPRARFDFVFDLEGCRRVEARARTEGQALLLRPAYRVRVHIERDTSAETEEERDFGRQPHFSLVCEPMFSIDAKEMESNVFELELPVHGELVVHAPMIYTGEADHLQPEATPPVSVQVVDVDELQKFKVELR